MQKRTMAGLAAVMTMAVASGGFSQSPSGGAPNCSGLPTAAQLQTLLTRASASTPEDPSLSASIKGQVGGLFGGQRMWGAVVNRDGYVCAYATSTTDPTQVWPGSQAIAKAKAYTANAFSLDTLALSTAQLYTFSQPGHSLWGLNQSQPFNPAALGSYGGKNQVDGGIITFGGGVPLYSGGKIIGGLGVSGDTACADHEIAKRTRDLAGLNPPGGPKADDISYSSADVANAFTHPLCLNTYRNGVSLGDEAPATGY